MRFHKLLLVFPLQVLHLVELAFIDEITVFFLLQVRVTVLSLPLCGATDRDLLLIALRLSEERWPSLNGERFLILNL